MNKKVDLNLPRGIRDIAPEKYTHYLWLFDRFREICSKYSYKIMEPATIEFFEILSLKSGPDIAKEIYDFRDKAGRHLGLRFDLTVGLTRYVVSHPELPKPVRLAAYSVQWRYDEPQFGRYRSFYSWDVEIYGGEELYSASEVILLVNNLLKTLGLKSYEILISDRRLIENIIKFYSPNADALSIMHALDKWGRYDEKEVISLIKNAGGENIEDMLSLLFRSKEEEFFSIVDRYGGEVLSKLYSLLRDDFSLKTVKLDPSIVRGLDYYDGVVFEVRDKKGWEIGSLVGGGAFSHLVSLFGGNMTAFGAAGGVERMLLAVEKEGINIPIKVPLSVIVIPLDKKFIPYSQYISEILRRRIYAVIEGPVQYRSLKKSLQYANRINADYAIFIGKNEMVSGKITLKNLRTREEHLVNVEDAVKILSSEKDK